MTVRLTMIHPPDLALQMKLTAPGQAHWATGGPQGTTCRECKHWLPVPYPYRKRDGTYDSRCPLPYWDDGMLRPRRCAMATQMSGRGGKKVPHDASSCRYFEAGPEPLPAKIEPTAANEHLWRRHPKPEESDE